MNPGIFVAIIVVVLTLIFFLYQKSKSVRRAVLFTGLCDSGKTLIYTRLLHKKFILTQTSIKENTCNYDVDGKVVKLIDIPGHERLRNKFFDQFKSSARAVVYVVDSVTIQKDIRDVAEFLYNILTDPIIVSNTPSILVLCNKQDVTLSKGSSLIKSMLEKELNTLRVTKSNQLESVDPKTKSGSFLGEEKKDFDFSQLKIKVEFAEANATNHEEKDQVNLQQLDKWLAKAA